MYINLHIFARGFLWFTFTKLSCFANRKIYFEVYPPLKLRQEYVWKNVYNELIKDFIALLTSTVIWRHFYLLPLFSSFRLIRFSGSVLRILTASVTWRSIGSFLKVSTMSILNPLISPLCLSRQCLHMSESSFLDIMSSVCSIPLVYPLLVVVPLYSSLHSHVIL